MDLPGPGHGLPVVLTQLFYTQNGYDVLQFLVPLQHTLNSPCHIVVLISDNLRVQNPGVGSQRVDGRVQALLGDGAFEGDNSVQVAEGRGNTGVGVVVGGDVDGLEGSDGTRLCGRDPLLEVTHLRGKGRLVSHSRGHPAQQGRDFHTGQDVPVDVVDEEKDVLPLPVPEVLGHREAGEGDPQTDSGGLVHLAEDHNGLVDNAGLLHLVPEVVPLTGALPDTCEDGEAAVLGGDVTYEFLNDDRFTNTRAAISPDLSSPGEGGRKIDDLEPSLQHLRLAHLLLE